MFKDILLFEEEHRRKANEITAHLLLNMRKLVVGVCGISGTGKSEIAWWINRLLYKNNTSGHIVNLDRFYKIPVEKREEFRRETRVIGPAEMDWKSINAEIFRFRNNDFDVLIFEGLYAGYVDTNYLYYIEKSDAFKFRKLRGKEDEENAFRRFVVKMESHAVEKTRDCADLVL